MREVKAFDRARLDRMREVLSGHVDGGDVPGLVAVVTRGEEAHVVTLGSVTLGGPPLAEDAIFRISSMTKPITAVAAMILVEECKLRLDDPVDALMPELADRRVLRRLDGPLDDTVPAERPITLRDLLTFRLGSGMFFANPTTHPIVGAIADAGLAPGPPKPSRYRPVSEWLPAFARLPLLHQPGDRWLYNTGSELLGVLIERAARQPFETFLRERIFEPLAMNDTGFTISSAQAERLGASYMGNTGGGLDVFDAAGEASDWTKSPPYPSGAAGLVSSAHDYASFSRMLLNGGTFGRERILSRASIEVMTTDQLTPEQKRKSGFFPGDFEWFGFGFGVSVVTRREHAWAPIGQYGWDGGLGSVWRADPTNDLTTVLLTNRMWSSPKPPPVAQDFWTLAYAALV